MNTVTTCFPGGKNKCLTMSYDDGVFQDKRLIEIFNRNGIKGTFHLNSAMFGKAERYLKPEEVLGVYQGHEASCHTATHPAIDRCPLPNVAQEVLEDRRNLEATFGYPVRGMSYPFGSHYRGHPRDAAFAWHLLLPRRGRQFYIRASHRFPAVDGHLPPQPPPDGDGRTVQRLRSRHPPAPVLRVGAQLRI